MELNCLDKVAPKNACLIYHCIFIFTGVCLQWDSNRAPGVRGGAAAAGGPTREYMPVADKVGSGKT